MRQNNQVQQTLLVYLRHELCTPINTMIGYSEMLLEELQTHQESTLFGDLQKIHVCGTQLLTLVTAILDPVQSEMSQPEGDPSSFGSTLRMELLAPLSTIVGYCEMLLKEAPAELIPNLDKLNTAAQQSLSQVNDIINLAWQLQTLNSQEAADQIPKLLLESPASAATPQTLKATPVVAPATQERKLKDGSFEKSAQGSMILVVDDNSADWDLISRQLKRQGYTVTIASNAPQALSLLQAVPYDLILLDVILPGMNGIELLEQLKRHDHWQHIPVIMISALDEIDGAVKCIEMGADDYLHQPCDPILLKTKIGASLEKKRLRDQEILYRQQVERLTAAAAAIETNTFSPDSLADLVQQPNELGQLARVFQHMASEVNSREQHLAQQVHLLQVAIDEGQKKRLVNEIAETDHFRQLQKRTQGSTDIENLYRSSLPPPPSAPQVESQPFAGAAKGGLPFAAPAVSQVVKRMEKPALDPDSPNVSTPKIVAIHSYQGGTGKSNLISNLAISVAKQGKRVGIIDTDLQSPGIHILFGLDNETTERTLNDYLWGRCVLYEAAHDLSHILQQPTGSSDGAIYLIPASAKAYDITRILREGYHEKLLLDGFAEIIRDLQLDFLLIDTHPGINEETLQAIAAANLLVMVLRPDHQDYQGTAVIVELARMLSVSKMLLVVNKALPTFDDRTYRQQLEETYDVPVAEILPFTEEMLYLGSREIFSIRYPSHPLTTAVDAMAQHIIDAEVTSCP